MCIRDRLKCSVKKGPTGESWIQKRLQLLMVYPQNTGATPVTPLTQKAITGRIFSGMVCSGTFPNSELPTPVSYTHLDVYKRQQRVYWAGKRRKSITGSWRRTAGRPLMKPFSIRCPKTMLTAARRPMPWRCFWNCRRKNTGSRCFRIWKRISV